MFKRKIVSDKILTKRAEYSLFREPEILKQKGFSKYKSLLIIKSFLVYCLDRLELVLDTYRG